MTAPDYSPDTLAFFTAECHRIHDLCDQANVPREQDGMAFTMSQRVEILAACFGSTVMQLAGATPDRVQH